MSYFNPIWLEGQRQRWTRNDAHRFAPPVPPKSFAARRLEQRQAEEEQAAAAAEQGAFEREVLALRRQLAELKFDLVWRWFWRKYNYNPNQPRDEQGRWTEIGGGGNAAAKVRLAGSDKPTLGRATVAILAGQVARKLIEAFRTENGLRDLFGDHDGTVALTTIDGKSIFGSNSTSPTYSSIDRSEAIRMRDTLLEKYPDVMDTENVGRRPNDAVFHAETNALLRAARENGGTLSGKKIEVYVDNPMCRSCDKILPLVGQELGNPTVTFVDPRGVRATMSNGAWMGQ
jgi:hypothetical protein